MDRRWGTWILLLMLHLPMTRRQQSSTVSLPVLTIPSNKSLSGHLPSVNLGGRVRAAIMVYRRVVIVGVLLLQLVGGIVNLGFLILLKKPLLPMTKQLLKHMASLLFSIIPLNKF